jgi:predicted Zn-dependent protease
VLRVVEIGLRVSPESEALQELRLRAAVAVEDMPLAAESARWVAAQSPSPRASLRHAAILMKSGDAGLALAALDDGLARFPLEPTLCRARTELALQGAAQ